jgi:hypothetical protein
LIFERTKARAIETAQNASLFAVNLTFLNSFKDA